MSRSSPANFAVTRLELRQSCSVALRPVRVGPYAHRWFGRWPTRGAGQSDSRETRGRRDVMKRVRPTMIGSLVAGPTALVRAGRAARALGAARIFGRARAPQAIGNRAGRFDLRRRSPQATAGTPTN